MCVSALCWCDVCECSVLVQVYPQRTECAGTRGSLGCDMVGVACGGCGIWWVWHVVGVACGVIGSGARAGCCCGCYCNCMQLKGVNPLPPLPFPPLPSPPLLFPPSLPSSSLPSPPLPSPPSLPPLPSPPLPPSLPSPPLPSPPLPPPSSLRCQAILYFKAFETKSKTESSVQTQKVCLLPFPVV